ncbi:MAG TPA: carboxypeptidase regulatory-like domain-containing protein [Lacunisphaera sp.]|nr:carboxypeptidase regulatory-like domain-containing protein [Lacunisphaera sp.]
MKAPAPWWLALAAGLLALAAGTRAATIEGRVALPKATGTTVVNKRYEIVSSGGVVSTNPPVAVVYLDGDFPAAREAPAVRVEQKDLKFVPQLLVVQAGTRVEFPNLDDTFHNIFSYSPAKRFDLGRYRMGEKPVPSVVFDTPGVVVLRCDIHEHMRGVILVLATPHFAITDTDGNFRLEGLPAGNYRLKTWLDSRNTQERAVELRADTQLRLELP